MWFLSNLDDLIDQKKPKLFFGRLFTVVLLGLYYVELLLYIESLSTIFANQDEVR